MRALASDFDGTIYFNGEFKLDDLKMIKLYQEKGNLFGICTGRPLADLMKDSNGYLELDFSICSSGALILDKHHNVLFKKCLDRKDIESICNQFKNDYAIYIQSDRGFLTIQLKKEIRIINGIIHSLDEEPGDIYSICIDAENEENAKKVCTLIKETYPNLSVHQNVNAIDIVDKHCSKGQGIQFIKDYFKIKHIAGIGDSYNDIPLLEEVNSAFTFPHGPIELKNKANYIVDSMSDAIATLLTEY